MFDGVAAGYDRTNTVLSFGQDRLWRRATRAALGLAPGQRVLDLAAGTGVSTRELALSGAYAVGTDVSLGMLRVGRARYPLGAAREATTTAGIAPDVPLLAGDALALPFRDGSFDAVTISFGLRNIHDPQAALRELARVTRPGQKLTQFIVHIEATPIERKVYDRLRNKQKVQGSLLELLAQAQG